MILVKIVQFLQLHWSSRQDLVRVLVILGIPRHQMHAISVRQIVIVQTRHLQYRVLPMPIRLLRRFKKHIANATRGTTGSQMVLHIQNASNVLLHRIALPWAKAPRKIVQATAALQTQAKLVLSRACAKMGTRHPQGQTSTGQKIVCNVWLGPTVLWINSCNVRQSLAISMPLTRASSSVCEVSATATSSTAKLTLEQLLHVKFAALA